MYPVDVTEVYSEPRVTARCDKHGLRPGTAMDLATGFTFSEKKDQQRAWKILRKETPHLVMLSPPCTARSKIRAISDFKRDPKVVAAEREATRKHMEFCANIAKFQYRAGRGFLLERPKGTGEDKEKEMMSLTSLPNVQTVSVDMCEHGLRVRLRDGSHSGLVRHASTIVTNVPEIAEAIQRRCSGLHKHHVLEGSFQTQQAAKYSDGFVDAILKGLKAIVTATSPVTTWNIGRR